MGSYHRMSGDNAFSLHGILRTLALFYFVFQIHSHLGCISHVSGAKSHFDLGEMQFTTSVHSWLIQKNNHHEISVGEDAEIGTIMHCW